MPTFQVAKPEHALNNNNNNYSYLPFAYYKDDILYGQDSSYDYNYME